MVKSSYSGKEIPDGTGIIYAKKDGTVYYFANRKEEMSFLKLKRNPVKVKWTNAFQKMKAARMVSEQKKKEAKQKK